MVAGAAGIVTKFVPDEEQNAAPPAAPHMGILADIGQTVQSCV
jgi:hypothetical protein